MDPFHFVSCCCCFETLFFCSLLLTRLVFRWLWGWGSTGGRGPLAFLFLSFDLGLFFFLHFEHVSCFVGCGARGPWEGGRGPLPLFFVILGFFLDCLRVSLIGGGLGEGGQGGRGPLPFFSCRRFGSFFLRCQRVSCFVGCGEGGPGGPWTPSFFLVRGLFISWSSTRFAFRYVWGWGARGGCGPPSTSFLCRGNGGGILSDSFRMLCCDSQLNFRRIFFLFPTEFDWSTSFSNEGYGTRGPIRIDSIFPLSLSRSLALVCFIVLFLVSYVVFFSVLLLLLLFYFLAAAFPRFPIDFFSFRFLFDFFKKSPLSITRFLFLLKKTKKNKKQNKGSEPFSSIVEDRLVFSSGKTR